MATARFKLEASARCALRRSCLADRRGLVTDAKVHGSGFLAGRVWDAVVVGGGHNGLTAAAYLARAGLQVAVLERRHVLGGAAVTEEIVPGFMFSRASYLQSLLRPGIIRELELPRHGLKLLPRNPCSFTPTADGQFLFMGPDLKHNEAEISKFSKKDAVAYPKYEHMLGKFFTVVDPLLDTVPPEAVVGGSSLAGRMADGWSKMKVLTTLLKRSSKLKQHEIASFMELLLAPASKVLDNWFESDVLKVTLASDAVIGAMASAHTPGSGYVLLHHMMGETNGARGIWSYVEGGMGAVSTAIARAASEAGATLATNAEAKQFLVEDVSTVGKAVAGVVLADGTEIRAKHILSNATPAVTFLKLMPENVLSEDFLTGVKSIDYKSGTTKINIAVDRLPMFRACGRTDNTAGPEHYGTIHLGADCMDEIDIAYKEASLGRASSRPFIEMTIPSTLDQTIAPPGKHVINLFVQYTPYDLRTGDWREKATRDAFANTCFDLIEEYAPGFTSSIIDYDMLTPLDLERVLGLTGGNIFHGAMGLDGLFLLRPLKGWSGYRTAVKGLYMCGAGAHPGGGVMGAPGRNAASVVLKDFTRA